MYVCMYIYNARMHTYADVGENYVLPKKTTINHTIFHERRSARFCGTFALRVIEKVRLIVLTNGTDFITLLGKRMKYECKFIYAFGD